MFGKPVPSRDLVYPKVAAARRPSGLNIHQFAHESIGPPQSENRTIEFDVQIGLVMGKIDAGTRAVVAAGRVDHGRVAPAASVFRQHVGIKAVQSLAADTDQAVFILRVWVCADEPLREGRRQGQEIPLPIGSRQLAIGLVVKRVGWHEIKD